MTGLHDLSAGPLVESREHPWRLWFDLRRQERRPGRPAVSVDTDLLAIEMAKLGLGMCLGPHLLIQPDLAEGSLIRLSEEAVSAGSGYHLDRSAASSRRDEIALFSAWIADTFAVEPSPGRLEDSRRACADRLKVG